MDAIQQLLSGLQKIPTAIAGGPVDLSNLVLGVLSGKGLSGVAEKPVGGSAWLNEKFGIEGGGIISDAIEMAGSSINPAAAAKSLAILVPAIIAKDANTVLKAQRALRKGADPHEVFADTGVYKNPASDDLMAVISDEGSKLRTQQLEMALYQGPYKPGPSALVSHDMFSSSALEDLLYHPELYARVPALKDLPVTGAPFKFGSAAYYPAEKIVRMGTQNSLPDFHSTLLHEVQHATQDYFSLPVGGSPDDFFLDPKAFAAAEKTVQELRQGLMEQIKAGTAPPESAAWLDSLQSHARTLSNADAAATKNYYSLAGEAEARLVQELFDLGPEFSKVYPPMLMEAELATRGLDSSQLINRANGPLQKVDTDPVVQAILEFARNRK